jgi:hypothetical protein
MSNIKYEELNHRIDRLEKVLESCRKDELFGGLIGKVNATRKDNAEVVTTLKSLAKKYPMDVKDSKYGFSVYCSFSIGKYAGSTDDYNIVIGERAKDKIVVELYRDGSKFYKDKVKGLTLNTKKIKDAVQYLLEKNFSKDELETMKKKSVTDSEVYANQEKERERELASLKDKDNSKNKAKSVQKSDKQDKSYVSRQDWVDLNPIGNAWILDPARI